MSKILIVDDDAVSRRLLNIILLKADKGYSIVEADSGKKALDLVEKEAPDIILLDVIMPEMDGFEVCEKLKSDEKYGAIPVLFLTSMEKTKDIVRGFRLGAADYITKPINADEVKIRVSAHLALKKSEEERIEADHLRILKDIVVTLNHNMNQPLMAAYTYINVALESLTQTDENRKVYGKLKEEMDRLNLILRKIQSLEVVKRTEYLGDTGMIDLDASQQKNKELQVQLRQVAKMAALGEFAAAVVHEMNQPLAAISNHIEILLMAQNITADLDLKNRIEKLKDQFIRLTVVVKRVSDYSKMRFEAMMKEDLNSSIKDSTYLFEQQLKDHNIELILDLDAAVPKIFIDRYQIQDVIINLLVNARDAIGDAYSQRTGGKIKILSRWLKAEAVVMVGVMDNGKPIAEGAQGKLFTSFFTTKDPSKGTGLGLAVCKDIIKKHKGLINFTVLKDGQKAFYFALPAEDHADCGKDQESLQQKLIQIIETS